MTGTGSTFANDLLLLLFQGTSIANVAVNATSSPITNIYVSLHTADPTAGNQTTSEAAYTSYSRVAVARTSSGWTVSTNTVVPVATVSFPAATGGSETEAYAGLGTVASTGTGLLLFAGSISPTIVVSNGVTPQLTTATTLTLT
jgi:hypothetical protein